MTMTSMRIHQINNEDFGSQHKELLKGKQNEQPYYISNNLCFLISILAIHNNLFYNDICQTIL